MLKQGVVVKFLEDTSGEEKPGTKERHTVPLKPIKKKYTFHLLRRTHTCSIHRIHLSPLTAYCSAEWVWATTQDHLLFHTQMVLELFSSPSREN